jgi:hypothetical protein
MCRAINEVNSPFVGGIEGLACADRVVLWDNNGAALAWIARQEIKISD